VRPVYVKISDRDAAPVTAKLPPRLQEGLTAAPALIAHLLVSKYCDHPPFYRRERILATRHGVAIGRNTMCRWAELATFWLRPTYQRIHGGLLESGYLQADDTPAKYLAPGTGKTATGYLWTLHRPCGDVLYQWHPGRGHACLDDLLGGISGIQQCDGYAAYDAHRRKHPGVTLAACWAHVRRKFHEALQIGQTLAAGPLQAIGDLYAIETGFRQARAGPAERAAVRTRSSAPILEAFRHDLVRMPRSRSRAHWVALSITLSACGRSWRSFCGMAKWRSTTTAPVNGVSVVRAAFGFPLLGRPLRPLSAGACLAGLAASSPG
jgi:hypothetical protein